MLHEASQEELNWALDKLARIEKLTADYVDALAKHHVARDSENRGALAGNCFVIRQNLDEVLAGKFQYNGTLPQIENPVDIGSGLF